MDIKACKRKGGIWNQRTKKCTCIEEIEKNHILLKTENNRFEITVSRGNLLIYGYKGRKTIKEQEPTIIYES